MPPILLCVPTMSNAVVGDLAVQVESSHQYSGTCYCCVTDGSRGAVWQNGIWHRSECEAKVCHWIPPCSNNGTHWHSLTLAEHLWRPNSGCEHTEVVGGVFQQWRQRHERQAIFWRAVHSYNTMKGRTSWSSAQVSGLWQGYCMWCWILASVCWKQWCQYYIMKFLPGRSHECSPRNRKNTICKFFNTYWTNMSLKVTVSWIASLLAMRCDVTTTTQSQNCRPWRGNMWIPHQRKSSVRSSQLLKWYVLSFGNRKGMILLDFLEPRLLHPSAD